jgi:UDP-glucose 4-epimerase
MKILITGASGDIAKAFAARTKEETRLISLRGDAWRDISFEGYDAVLHTAGLAHVRESGRNRLAYFSVNRDLAFETAKKARADGVRQFVFLSSIAVYGLLRGHITADTPAVPASSYGRSKLEAEALITGLAGDSFHAAVLRPPMVYGPGCPGNYAKLCRLAEIAPFFPDYENARSLVSIENLCTQIESVIAGGQGGLFFPRDPAPVSTAEMAAKIAKARGRTLPLTRAFNIPISLMMPRSALLSKLFGSLTIDPLLPNGE